MVLLSICDPTSFATGSSPLDKGKAKGKVIDTGVFCVLLGADLTVLFHFTGSFIPCFGVLVLPGKFCEGTEPGSNLPLKDDFFISISIKWW